MRKITLFLFILAGLAWKCTTDGLRPDLSAEENAVESRAKKFVPFKGEADWTSSAQQFGEGRCAQVNPAFATILFEATGELTHMGKVKINGSQCVDPTGHFMSPLAIVDGLVTMTAANGDEVWYSAAGGLVPTPDPLVFAVDVDYSITGGTGRFRHAEGEGHVGGSVTFLHFPPLPGDPPAQVHNVYDGLIAY